MAAGFTACCYIVLNHIGKRKENTSGINSENGSRSEESNPFEGSSASVYERNVKQIMDKLLSFTGLIILAPVYAIIALMIWIDDPGPVLFTQKRVGQGKQIFLLHKFRSMKMSTPHDVPTHQLQNPEQYITGVGKFLRKYSLDELPQIWDIFRGKMSIIGPRPALWNQDDLVAERDKYGANDVLPGLTGWAQINGRDELEIAEKARLDGEYVKHLRQGGIRALFFDVRCFLGTIASVIESEGVVEGGTGELYRTGKVHITRDRAGTAADRGIRKKSQDGIESVTCKKATAKKVNGVRLENNSEKVPAQTALTETEKRKIVDETEAGFEDYGHLKHFAIDISEANKKRVLITGAGSYIGEAFERWAKKHYPVNFTIDTVDMRKSGWRQKDFSGYDAVFHVAGLAHADVGKVSEKEKKNYYAVNTDLAIETAAKAKAEGVKQFVFMSSMIIYGESAPYGKEKVIDETTVPAPANFYGDSKWQADKGVRKLADRGERAPADGAFQAETPGMPADGAFHVAVLRPPMIYGRGSKGNYPVLAKLAKTLPVFPDVENRRSMLYIDNLCEFLCKLMLSGEGGIYFPQNGEYTRTSQMVETIAGTAGKRIWVTKLLNPVVTIGKHMPGKVSGLVNKAFGNCVYGQRLSEYEGLEYRVAGLEDSIENTEGADAVQNFKYNGHKCSEKAIESSQGSRREGKQKDDNEAGSKGNNGNNRGEKPLHILVVSQYFYPETFRINDIASEWVKRGYKVTVLTGIPNYPMGRFFEGYGYRSRRREQWNGIEIIRIPLIPRGTNSIGMAANYLSFVLSGWWWKMITDVHADLVFTFEVSPMTQALIGVWYAKKHHIPHFLYVQDLWPENVETVAGIKNRAVIYPIDRMVDYIYRNTNQIFATSKSFARAIINRKVKVKEGKVHFWPQYAEEFYRPLDREKVRKTAEKDSPVRLIPEDGSFKIAFTGNIGTAQGLDILPKAAVRLKNCHTGKPVRFVIVGDGRYQEAFEEEIRRQNVADSFIMIPRQKPEEIPKLLACCDAAFLSFGDDRLWEKTIPAKLQSYMACGMPIIAAAGGETERMIKDAGCGICSPVGDPESIVKGIQELMCSALGFEGKRGRIYAQKFFNEMTLMDQMDKWFNDSLCAG